MTNHPPEPIRLAIVLDVNDHNRDLLFIWAGIRAAKLVHELRGHGVGAEVVSIDIDGDTRHNW
ncbi:MAG TPA: hypothetical protein VFG94_12105 [Acidimicrobiales bacterium]|nr:hypothetical protein [Acidimicrobiales bacterium]